MNYAYTPTSLDFLGRMGYNPQAMNGALPANYAGYSGYGGSSPVSGIPTATNLGQFSQLGAPNVQGTFNPVTDKSGGMLDGLGGLDMAKGVFGGLQTIGNLWGAFQAQKLAKDQFNYAKSVGETNLANGIQSYNTALTDRANARASYTGQSAADTAAYIEANKMVRR